MPHHLRTWEVKGAIVGHREKSFSMWVVGQALGCEHSIRVINQMDNRPRLLDLFSGAGGAAMGYYRAGFRIVGVDINPQKHYPFEFHQADAMTYPLEGFDVIHASPPCQGYSRTNAKCRCNHPRMIEAVRQRLAGKRYVIENVQEARGFLINPVMLCGSMFLLPIHRHRYFESSVEIFSLLPKCRVDGKTVYITGTPRPKDGSARKDPPARVKREAMGTPWMTIKEMDEAIPPAYTFWIGTQLMEYLGNPGIRRNITQK